MEKWKKLPKYQNTGTVCILSERLSSRLGTPVHSRIRIGLVPERVSFGSGPGAAAIALGATVKTQREELVMKRKSLWSHYQARRNNNNDGVQTDAWSGTSRGSRLGAQSADAVADRGATREQGSGGSHQTA
jgi:hypothetical protein